MAREGLMDDCGYRGFDNEPDCENCKHSGYRVQHTANGMQIHHECEAKFCEFELADKEEQIEKDVLMMVEYFYRDYVAKCGEPNFAGFMAILKKTREELAYRRKEQ